MPFGLQLHPPSLPRPVTSPACNFALASDDAAVPSAVSLNKKPNDSGLVFREKLLYLQSLNVDPHKALRLNPAVRSATLTSIVSLEECLLKFGLSSSEIGRILDMHPMLLTADPLPPINFLVKEVALQPPELPLSISRCPRILASPVESQLRPALNYLRDLGLHVDAHTTLLLVSNVEKTLIPKIRFLEYVGFRDDEVREMVVRSPGLLTMSVEKNMVPKIRYFLDEMKGDLQEVKQFPQFFSFSLERKIRPRHKTLVEHRLKMSLPEMLRISDGEFSARLLEMRLSMLDARELPGTPVS